MMGVEDMPQMKSLSPGPPLSPPKKQQVSTISHLLELFFCSTATLSLPYDLHEMMTPLKLQ